MKYACLFRENEEPILVSAEDIKNGIYSKDEEFIDPEYEFRVIYVKGARNNGGPHFRLYLSREDYNKLSPKRKSRYDYLRKMRHFDDSEWHKKWKQLFSGICDIEKCIKNESNGRWKFADAFYNKTKTCIEFQHSYIAFDFEERNEFYSNLSIKTIWLYDLSNSNVCEDIHGNIEILEDNAKGFFRISEVSKNLSDHYVYIQVKSGVIYRVSELNRREIPGNLRSTIRYFALTEKYTENEFIEAIKMNTIGTYSCKEKIENPLPLNYLWENNYIWMIAKNIEDEKQIFVNCNGYGGMYRDYENNCVKYKYYVDNDSYSLKDKKEYFLSHEKENRPIWVLVNFRSK